jgi:NAD(P)-dependent dehydrogenase (short-subunit alcohol dehydrogenase family)
LDLTGVAAVLTGCDSGIGYETMRVLALRDAHFIGAARTTEKRVRVVRKRRRMRDAYRFPTLRLRPGRCLR